MKNYGYMIKILSLSVFLVCLAYGCTSVESEQPKNGEKNNGKEYYVIDLSFEDKWPVDVWKIRDRKLIKKPWIL